VAILFTQDWWEHVAISIYTGLVGTCGNSIYTGLVGTCDSIYLHRIGGNMWQYLFTQDWWEHVAIFGFHFVLEIK
jgi:hypothetical protein